MKRNMLRRTTLREIRSTRGRFMAILAIIALGVGFFSGVRITTPAMVHTVDDFLQRNEFFDYRLISTLGWEEEDVETFRKAEGVRFAEGSNSLDILCLNAKDDEFVLKSHTLPENLNMVELRDGRLPEKGNECLADADTGLKIGETIRVSPENDEDTTDSLVYDEYVVVGEADSSFYLNHERGTTSIGNGSVAGFLYLLPEAYDLDYYSEIYIRFDMDKEILSDEYKDAMDALQDEWEALTQKQADARYERILLDAEEKLQDGKDELEEKRAEGQQELDDAEKELADGKKELLDGEQELADAEQELLDAKQELDDALAELEEAKQEIEDGEKELADAKAQLDNGKKTLDSSEQQLLDGENQLAAGQSQLDAAFQTLNQNDATLSAGEQALATQEAELNAQLAQAEPMWDLLPPEQQAQLTTAKEQIAAAKQELAANRSALEAGRQELNAQQRTVDEKRAQLREARTAFEKGKAEFQEKYKLYEDSVKTFEEGKAAYEEGLEKYEEGLASYEEGLQKFEDGKKDYKEGKKEYEDGLAEYEDGKQEFEEKIADAEAEIADAEEELADLEKPDTYVLDRATNIGYACFESDSQIVEQVARVFPIFFILVAALVCMTTMSRMVEEQRTQIGVLKALGYSEAKIMGKFLFYAGSASFLGCVIGYVVGIFLFPTVIWMSYQLMYVPLHLVYIFDWKLAVMALVVSLLCSMGTTWATCRIELSESAAGLMRPKAPKAGKRVFLEYVPFIWNRMKFLYKVSFRNIFRYKGRFFMMIIGISGCTALLLTGFGLKDSIAGFAEVQYGEILVADAAASLKNGIGNELPEELTEKLDELTEDYLVLHEASWDLVMDNGVKALDLIVPFDSGAFDSFMHTRTMDGEDIPFPGVGEVIVGTSVAERFGAEIGTTITLRNEDMEELHLTVTGVFENHVYNNIVLSEETMRKQLGDAPKMNTLFLNFPEDADAYQVSAELANDENISTFNVFDEMAERMSKMMDSLDYIILLVIVCAAGLAFIVLYNLTNINITERIREIATIKVLGFFRNETSAYVLRENLALTALGIIAGLALGILLHRFVMAQIVVDMVSFRVRILPLSYLYSVGLTFVFNFIVNAVMSVKLDRINMAESLKSVD